jgi:hypothetical protein
MEQLVVCIYLKELKSVSQKDIASLMFLMSNIILCTCDQIVFILKHNL